MASAIEDWLRAEDALDDGDKELGQVDVDTEEDYRELDEAGRGLDVISAGLDGLRAHLLGFDALDGLRRESDGQGGTVAPRPARAPHSLLAGTMVLERARLVDIFGRTLEVPEVGLKQLAAPSRTQLDEDSATLGLAPRLLRPARWLFRWVDAATAGGMEGTEARVDQVDPALMVNPVAGPGSAPPGCGTSFLTGLALFPPAAGERRCR